MRTFTVVFALFALCLASSQAWPLDWVFGGKSASASPSASLTSTLTPPEPTHSLTSTHTPPEPTHTPSPSSSTTSPPEPTHTSSSSPEPTHAFSSSSSAFPPEPTHTSSSFSPEPTHTYSSSSSIPPEPTHTSSPGPEPTHTYTSSSSVPPEPTHTSSASPEPEPSSTPAPEPTSTAPAPLPSSSPAPLPSSSPAPQPSSTPTPSSSWDVSYPDYQTGPCMLLSLGRIQYRSKADKEPALLCPEQEDGCTNVGEWVVDNRAKMSDCGTSADQPNPILILKWQHISSTGTFTPKSINITFIKEEPFQVSSVDFLFVDSDVSPQDEVASFPGGVTFEVGNDRSLKCTSLTTKGSLKIGTKDVHDEPEVTFINIQLQGAKGVLPFCRKDSPYTCGFSPEDTSCGSPTTSTTTTTTRAPTPKPTHKKKKGMGVGGVAGISICMLLIVGGGLAYYVRYRVRQNRIKTYSAINNEFDE